MPFTLTSSAFNEGDSIPKQYTCEGEDVPPPIAWSGAPDGTRGFALIMDDPDAPNGTFTHWLLYDMPAQMMQWPDERGAGKTLLNSFGRSGYGGPCPPPGHGPHRYFFTMYAVDVPTLELAGDQRRDLESALGAHTLATARLMGRYERTRRGQQQGRA
jgi:Raf kinase inhibitor-like YbhB/YbcL family protein